MIIGGFQKTSLIDYPNKIAAIVFTQGCNFRCGYCHNPELAELKKTEFKTEEILDFLESRIGKLDAVVITGGEPTLHGGLTDFIREVKHMGYLVKLDTNGTNPNLLASLIENELIDYIAMDVKAPLYKYEEITKSNIKTETIYSSIKIIMESKINYEFRTTLVNGELDISDLEEMGKLLKDAKAHYIQNFVATKTIDSSFLNKSPLNEKDLSNVKSILNKYIDSVHIR